MLRKELAIYGGLLVSHGLFCSARCVRVLFFFFCSTGPQYFPCRANSKAICLPGSGKLCLSVDGRFYLSYWKVASVFSGRSVSFVAIMELRHK